MDSTREFKNETNCSVVSAFPMLLNFRKLMLCPYDCVVPAVTNIDLLHAVVAMYNVCLSEMTPDILYSYVCDKESSTIVLICDLKDCCEALNNRITRQGEKQQENREPNDVNEMVIVKVEENHQPEEDVYIEAESCGVFDEVYSDTEDETEDEEEDEEEEDFSQGIGKFVKDVICRRNNRLNSSVPINTECVAIENRLLGCITFEKKYVKSTKVIHITLLSVRKRLRNFGMGSYLLGMIHDVQIMGDTEAIVVHADNEAVPFFTKFNYTDDIILNSRWSELAEKFTNCTIMSYLPSFSASKTNPGMREKNICPTVAKLDKEFTKWTNKWLEAYQGQVSCMFRYREEMKHLSQKVSDQREIIDSLMLENSRLHKENLKYNHRHEKGDALIESLTKLNVSEHSALASWTVVGESSCG